MKKNRTIGLLALAIAALLLVQCKRENPNQATATQVVASAANTHKVQQWLNGNPKALNGLKAGLKTARKAGTTLPKIDLQWAEAGFDAASRTHWVPAAPANTKKTSTTANTYLVATQDEQGQITGGQYVMVLPNAKKMGEAAAKAFKPMLLLAQRPDGFSGSVLYYDVQGQLTGSKVYEAGQLQPTATANLAARDEAEGDPGPNYALIDCSMADGCIDWYWQTYVNGVLVSEDYLFTTCCGGSGGGGGNNANECQAQLDAMLATGAVVTNAPIIETTIAQSNLEWTKGYKWLIFTAANVWKLYSYEKGVLEKVYYPSSNQSLWEYKSFEHVKIDAEGFTAGGEWTFSDNGAIFNKTKYTVYEHLDFSVTAKTCGISRTSAYNGEKRFVAPNHIQYVQRQGS